MAKVRIGFSTQFELENELVGIGTDNPTNTLQALGNIHVPNAKAVGVSTFTTFDGFVDTKAAISGAGGAKSGSISGEIIIEGEVTVSTGTTFTSGPENLTVTDNFTLPGVSDDKTSVGTTRFNENLAALEFYTGNEWRAVNSIVDSGNMGRGIFGFMENPGGTDLTTISFVNIQSLGNAQFFGDLTVGRANGGACSSETRGLFGGGQSSPTRRDTIDYVSIASAGNAVDFGNLVSTRANPSSLSSSTRGIWSGGQDPAQSNVIEYVEISTIGNAIDFGDLMATLHANRAVSSPTRGVFGGGSPSPLKITNCEYITIASKGNAVKFGDLTVGRAHLGAASNSVRGIFAGGNIITHPSNHRTIDYITIASTGNAIDFGDQIVMRDSFGGTADKTRAVFFGGRDISNPSETKTNIIDYVEIATTGNSMDFGDCMDSIRGMDACSDSHGGLGGF